MNESSKRHSKLLSLIFILNCLSKASITRKYSQNLFTILLIFYMCTDILSAH